MYNACIIAIVNKYLSFNYISKNLCMRLILLIERYEVDIGLRDYFFIVRTDIPTKIQKIDSTIFRAFSNRSIKKISQACL